ncbi:MAG: 2-phospho-L-lactate transferase [Proteobacteria bacterium]|nr:2-phospho-L-lactate transferase [Pseudomonadota bacterium]
MPARPIAALAGGVGAARFLAGLVRVVPPEDLSVIVNTGDDRDFFGLRVCPDLDTVMYTLAGEVDPDQGWGRRGESFHCLESLRRLGGDSWFRLGDRDLAVHVLRTQRLRQGARLDEVTAELCAAFGVRAQLLPMTCDPSATLVVRQDGTRTDFQEYLVRDGAPDDVAAVDLSAAAAATPAPGVMEALEGASTLLICPSNPVVSIGTILQLPGVRALLERRRDAVGVSPIIGGRPVKGPADRLLPCVGAEVSALGVARLYRDLCAGLVIDRADAGLATPIEELGLRVRVEETLMRDSSVAMRLAGAALELASPA